MLLSNIIT